MVELHWILEYVKVFCGYFFIMFIWPSFVFQKYLKNKSFVFRFSFCSTIQVVLINTIVTVLGLFHLLNRWMIVILFYGLFLNSVISVHKIDFSQIKKIYHLILGVYGIKLFLYRFRKKLFRFLKYYLSKAWNIYQKHLFEYTALISVIIFGMLYFGYSSFQHFSYGTSDLSVHHQWIYGLIKGKVYSGGIYPAGMHCFIYSMYALFGIRVYSILLFLGGIHVSVFLISSYCLFREVFKWRFVSIFVIAAFLILAFDLDTVYRLQWTVPQEFGTYTQFLCVLYLTKYINNAGYLIRGKKKSNFYWDENLILFGLAISASISIQFYTTIIAFFLCLCFAVFSLKKIFDRHHLGPIIFSVFCGLFISIMPMAGAFISGIPLQGSIGWALSIINPDSSEEESGEIEEDAVTDKDQQKSESSEKTAIEKENDRKNNRLQKSIFVRIEEKAVKILNVLREKLIIIWKDGYTIFGMVYAESCLVISVFCICLWFVYRLTAKKLHIFFKKEINRSFFDKYISIILAQFIFFVLLVDIGLPRLMENYRLNVIIQYLIVSTIFIPVDMIFSLIMLFCNKMVLQILSLCCTYGIYIFAVFYGRFHTYMFSYLSRYNQAVMVTESIIEQFPKDSYTIVSPTEELYQVTQYGRHEELLKFVQLINDQEYSLPTEYVFLYIEKKPLKIQQIHYFSGPSWLASKKYVETSGRSICPNVICSQISESAAEKDLIIYPELHKSYRDLNSRTIIESKAYKWCHHFAELYPNEFDVYYEDDDFVCYYFRQEPGVPYNLAIDE